MSVSDKEISNVGLSDDFGAASGVDGDDDEDGESGVQRRIDRDHDHDHDDDQRRKEQRVKGHGFGVFSFSTGLGKRAKSFVLRPLKRKVSKKKTHVTNKGSSSSSACRSNSLSGSGHVNNSGNKGCYFCFTRASVGESVTPNWSQTSDPNDPNFTYDMLRVLIERNEFCSKECNTHLDSDDCCRD